MTGPVVVCSGGANLGALQVGMLRELLERGVRPAALIGSSVGAINAAFLAVDPTPARAERLHAVWSQVHSKDIFGGSMLGAMVRLRRAHAHIHHTRGLTRLLADWFEPDDLSRTRVPLHVATTELATGTVRWWRAGSPVPILVASAAMPLVFPPVRIDGALHVDGALVEPVGLRRAVAIAAPGTEIIVLDTGATAMPLAAPKGPVAVVAAAMRASRVARLDADRELAADARVTWISADAPKLRYDDFSHTEALVDLGRLAVARHLDGERTIEAV